MKKIILITISTLLLIGCAEMNSVLEEVNKVTDTGPAPLSNSEVISGLKEALTVGTNNSTSLTSQLDGFYKNPEIFIPFPPEALKVRAMYYGVINGASFVEPFQIIRTINYEL